MDFLPFFFVLFTAPQEIGDTRTRKQRAINLSSPQGEPALSRNTALCRRAEERVKCTGHAPGFGPSTSIRRAVNCRPLIIRVSLGQAGIFIGVRQVSIDLHQVYMNCLTVHTCAYDSRAVTKPSREELFRSSTEVLK